MAERINKKRKFEASGGAVAKTTIMDPRFANLQTDPRYRLPGKRNKVKLDSRFSQALKEDDFSRRAKVDRYGRPLETNAERNRLKRKYEFEGESDEQSDDADDDDEVQHELKRVNQSRDTLREGKFSNSSSSSSSSDEDSDSDIEAEEAELAPQTQSEVPTGEVSSRLAVVNLDWDNIRAQDLMAVFSSFLESGGKLQHVAIYPSEFGRERLQREEIEGPPPEIFARNDVEDEDEEETGSEDDEAEDEDDEAIKSSMLKADDGADFDSQALRRYQLERLRYFYAVLTFSSATAAKKIYDAVDGTEYLSTANFFDLRFVPDSIDFSTETPREECTEIPADYKPNAFVTDALQHSKVKLTWDAEDTTRKEAQARAFRGGQKEIDENDLKAYLGSDSSSSESEADEPAPLNDDVSVTTQSKRDTSRAKMRSLLGLAPEQAKSKTSKKDKGPVGNVQITFSAGLSGNNADDKKRSVFVNTEEEANETTLERYVRKEKERKSKRRDKAKTSRTEQPDDAADSDVDMVTADSAQEAPAGEDLGFEDPFFAEPSNTASKASNKIRKEERLKKRREREEEEKNNSKQRAELEKLMAHDDDDDDDGDEQTKTKKKGKGMRHFDMRDIEKAEKAERKSKKSKSKSKASSKSNAKNDTSAAAGSVNTDAFDMNTQDPRFTSRLFSNHDFAIDPTNPKYKETKAMKALLEEGRRRQKDKIGKANGEKGEKGENGRGDGGAKALAEKLKKSKKA